MSLLKQSKCKGCGKTIAFVQGEKGKWIPLDHAVPVFEVKQDLTGEPRAFRAEGIYVSHFSVCPKAEQFSASRRTG